MIVEDGTVSRTNESKNQVQGSKDELSEYKLDDYDEDDKPGGPFCPIQITFAINQDID